MKHIWFDFSETIVFLNKENHDHVRYSSYAQATKKPINKALIAEYERLYRKHKQSNAAVFWSLGLPADYWSTKINSVDPREIYQLADAAIPEILEKMRHVIPISLFSNIQVDRILNVFGIQSSWFAHILTAGMLKEPKPALDGFQKMVELSKVPPDELLYIGDDVEKDIRPAKKAGIQTGLMWSNSPEADYSFERFEDILTLVQKSEAE